MVPKKRAKEGQTRLLGKLGQTGKGKKAKARRR
jgi:hypothetical protein